MFIFKPFTKDYFTVSAVMDFDDEKVFGAWKALKEAGYKDIHMHTGYLYNYGVEAQLKVRLMVLVEYEKLRETEALFHEKFGYFTTIRKSPTNEELIWI